MWVLLLLNSYHWTAVRRALLLNVTPVSSRVFALREFIKQSAGSSYLHRAKTFGEPARYRREDLSPPRRPAPGSSGGEHG